ncbi:hypothetical protein JYU34_017040 [Plutella xylostella]|uniref:Uncharacterized protein n=1 Tax=Plutella xylostella TaxID=51655 RepID=A0ABQ7Q537_PLUXY|nr:hypothetical protein JYU34_017040 [Plutella xylostella]
MVKHEPSSNETDWLSSEPPVNSGFVLAIVNDERRRSFAEAPNNARPKRSGSQPGVPEAQSQPHPSEKPRLPKSQPAAYP